MVQHLLEVVWSLLQPCAASALGFTNDECISVPYAHRWRAAPLPSRPGPVITPMSLWKDGVD
eukprot:2137034-Rhodomonas_salina.5